MIGHRALIARHALEPHPEGGWFRETFRDSQRVATPFGQRPRSTRILFLLADGQVSRLHRLRQDEVWQHEDGPGLDLHVFGRAGAVTTTRLAADREPVTVPAGRWMGAEASGGWALVSCTCKPGFAYDDLEFAAAAAVRAGWPAHTPLIARLVP
jgi:predicted cupin superfamily sugar epimerase